MKKAIWGPIVWNLLHCLTIKIKDTAFISDRYTLLYIISSICTNLPCPECSSHARKLIKKYKFLQIPNKKTLIHIMFLIHNEVNVRTKKKNEDKKIIDMYQNKDMKRVVLNYIKMNNQIVSSSNMMLYSFHKNLFLDKFKKYIVSNIDNFE